MLRSLALLGSAALLGACASAPASDNGMTPGMATTSPSAIASSAAAARGAADGPLVIFVRHAEKADNTADPVLSADGERRAQALLAALRDAGITHVITTELQRTRLTAAPLASVLGLTPEVVATQGSTPHVMAMAAAIRRRAPGEVVLVVGHSNSVPAYVAALGAQVAPICDAQHDNLFVMHLGGPTPRIVRAKYGATSPAC